MTHHAERLVKREAALRAAACLSLLVFLPQISSQVHAQAQPGPLKIVGSSRLTLDPVCNAREGVIFEPLIRNDGPKEVPLSLSISDPTPKTAGKIAAAKVSVAAPEAAGKALGASQTLRVRVDLQGTLEPGEWEIDLRNGGAAVGTLTVLNPQAGFGVKLDTATPDNPELTFERDKPATIPLKNGDSFDYRVVGEYSVRGYTQKITGDLFLPANGGGELTLIPLEDWFAPWLRTYFKDDVAEGRLTLRFISKNCLGDTAAPRRVYKIKTMLAPWSTEVKEYTANGILLLVLLAGGLCSLALNFFLPAHDRRQKASDDLLEAQRRINDIPVGTDPRVRISVAVERRQLTEQLRRLDLFDGRFSAEMTDIERGLARLALRLDLLGQMQLVLNRYWRHRCVIVSDDIEELRTQVINLLSQSNPTDGNIQAARGLIGKIDEQMAGKTANAPNTAVAARLVKKIGTLLTKDFEPAKGPIGTSPVWKNQFAELAEELVRIKAAPAAATDIDPADYAQLGQAVFILEQVRDFIGACRATDANGALNATQTKTLFEPFIAHLRAGGWDRFIRAQRLVQKIRQDTFFVEIEAEIANQRVDIEPTRPVLRQFEPAELRIVFFNKLVDGAAARNEYRCHWEVTHPKLPTVEITSSSWSLPHFFVHATMPEPEPEEWDMRKLVRWLPGLSPASQGGAAPTAGAPNTAPSAGAPGTTPPGEAPYAVTATFIAEDNGERVAHPITKNFHVRPPLAATRPSSVWTGWLRLGFALGIAVVALVAGAREQILKLDLFPALLAIFLIGFGSDQIKNIFTQRAAASEDSKTPKT